MRLRKELEEVWYTIHIGHGKRIQETKVPRSVELLPGADKSLRKFHSPIAFSTVNSLCSLSPAFIISSSMETFLENDVHMQNKVLLLHRLAHPLNNYVLTSRCKAMRITENTAQLRVKIVLRGHSVMSGGTFCCHSFGVWWGGMH